MNSFPGIVTYSVIAMGYNRVYIYIYSMYEKNMRVIVMIIRSTYSIIWVVQWDNAYFRLAELKLGSDPNDQSISLVKK